jgi:undecaprenyl pyrophosphate synthase
MSWRIGYAELYFAKEHYPAFSNQKFDEAIAWFDTVS